MIPKKLLNQNDNYLNYDYLTVICRYRVEFFIFFSKLSSRRRTFSKNKCCYIFKKNPSYKPFFILKYFSILEDKFLLIPIKDLTKRCLQKLLRPLRAQLKYLQSRNNYVSTWCQDKYWYKGLSTHCKDNPLESQKMPTIVAEVVLIDFL